MTRTQCAVECRHRFYWCSATASRIISSAASSSRSAPSLFLRRVSDTAVPYVQVQFFAIRSTSKCFGLGVPGGEASTIPSKMRLAQTSSSVEIINKPRGSKTPTFLRVATTMRTVMFKITKMCTAGATWATAAKSWRLDASL